MANEILILPTKHYMLHNVLEVLIMNPCPHPHKKVPSSNNINASRRQEIINCYLITWCLGENLKKYCRYIFGRATSMGDNTTTWRTQPTSHLLMCRYLNGVLCFTILWSIVGQETPCMGWIVGWFVKAKLASPKDSKDALFVIC